MNQIKLFLRVFKNMGHWSGVTKTNRLSTLLSMAAMRIGRSSNEVAAIYMATTTSGDDQFDELVIENRVIDRNTRPLRILLVDHEKAVGISGIVSRIADELYTALKGFEGIEVHLSEFPIEGFDVVHHFIYTMATKTDAAVTTTMITHVDSPQKIRKVSRLIESGVVGICMSMHTKTFVESQLEPSANGRLFMVPPVPMIEAVKRRIRLAYVSNSYPDGRKRESLLIDAMKNLKSDWIHIDLMGSGLEGLADELEKCGIHVDLKIGFDNGQYQSILETADYFVYLGLDEGAISILDACASGVEVITTDQGFHRSLAGHRTHFVDSAEQLHLFLIQLIDERNLQSKSARLDEWPGYAERHLRIWEQLVLLSASRVAN
jgi:hypothetical protein